MYSVVLMMALTAGADAPSFHRGGCNGCSGGYTSCAGSCHGCSGRVRQRSHGCCGSVASTCHGCSASACSGCHSRRGCHRRACNGCGGCYAAASCGGCHGPATTPHATPVPKTGEKLKVAPKPTTAIAAPARIIVSLPATAKLLVDGADTRSTSATRVFASPALEPGKEFYYTFTGEIASNGRTVTASKKIIVRAGEQVDVQLDFPTETLAQR
jgi:uncharacterized protein (TIGR03000 family)